MKIKDGFMLCEIAGDTVIVPYGDAAREFHGMIKVNDTGKALWNRLTEGAELSELTALLTEQFGAEPQIAAQDAADFVAQLKEIGCLA